MVAAWLSILQRERTGIGARQLAGNDAGGGVGLDGLSLGLDGPGSAGGYLPAARASAQQACGVNEEVGVGRQNRDEELM